MAEVVSPEAIAAAQDVFDKARVAGNSLPFCLQLALETARPYIIADEHERLRSMSIGNLLREFGDG